MFDPFHALMKLGFTRVPAAQAIYEKEAAPVKAAEAAAEAPPAVNPEQYIFLRKYTCPACDKTFEDFALRETKCRFVRGDTDLRAHYEPYDPMFYNVVICHHCGYAAMNAHFNKLTDRQAGMIREQVTPQYKFREYPLPFSAKDAAERYQLALLCAIAKKAKNSEKAMLCLRLSWLAREAKDEDEEKGYQAYALEGFEAAYEKESFPLYGMDHVTLMYLMGELCRRVGRKEDALRYVGRVITSPGANERLKDRARQVKELIQGETP